MKNPTLLILFALFLSAGPLSAEETKDKPWCDENYYVESPDVITIESTKPTDATKNGIVENFDEHFELRGNMSVTLTVRDEYGSIKSVQKFKLDSSGVLDLREMLKRKTARVVISDLTIREAQELVLEQFPYYEKVELTVTKVDPSEFFTNHLVNHDGNIVLGNQKIHVNGLTTKEIEEAIEMQFPNLEKGTISVSVFAYNSKEFYVIFQSDSAENKGDCVYAFPCEEKTTLRSALGAVSEGEVSPNDRVWIARPVGNSDKPEILLGADWKTITTDPKIYPGDRIFVEQSLRQ